MKIKCMFNLFLFSICIHASDTYAVRNFPSNTEVEAIVKTCGLGYSKSINGSIEAGLKKWISEAEIKGNGSITELGGILVSLSNDGDKVKVYELYLKCIKDTLPQYMISN